MTVPQLLVIALVYVATLVLGMRGVGAVIPQAQEAGFVLAAVASGVTAAIIVRRRGRGGEETPASAIFVVGLLTAVCGVIVGLACQRLWQPMIRPAVSLSIAGVATLVAPFFIVPLVGRLWRDDDDDAANLEAARPVGELHVVVTLLVAAVMLAIAYLIPVPGRSSVRLVGKYFPSLFVGLPEWEAEQNAARMDFGSIKLKDPGGAAKGDDRFLALRWIDSDSVQADEHIQSVVAGALNVRSRSPVSVGRHEGTTFYLESDDRLNRGVVTIWNCPQDHRVLWLFSYLSGPKSSLLATHEKILRTVQCHTGRNKDAGATTKAQEFPAFTPPAGFEQLEGVPGAYVAEGGRQIVFDPAVPGKSDLDSGTLAPAVVAKRFASTGLLDRIEGEPTLTTVPDLQGHTRRVWSIRGVEPPPSRAAVQVDVMVWHCDVRDMTFIVRYRSTSQHDPREGIDAMLPAACHK
jgi:hypothetical protein